MTQLTWLKFWKNVFNDTAMKERLPKSVYKKLKQTIEDERNWIRPLHERSGPCNEGLGN